MVMVELNQNNWEEEVDRSNILTLAYFWHQQCLWCRRLTSIIERLAEDYLGKVKFARLNILELSLNQEIATNLEVMGIPTLDLLLWRASFNANGWLHFRRGTEKGS
jgi:thioredoxin 1